MAKVDSDTLEPNETNMKHSRHIPALLLLTIITVVGISALAADDHESKNKLKAEYIFAEAINQKNLENGDAYYDLLEHAYQTDSTNTNVAFYLGYCMLMTENLNKARAERGLQLMKKHFDKSPGDFYETTFYSDANMMLGHPDEALRAIRSLCQKNPNRPELMARLAQAQAQTGDFDGSNITYDSIQTIQGISLPITQRKIANYMQLNDTASSISEMRRLLATAPLNVDYNIFMGALLTQLGMNDSALYYLDKAQKADPNNGNAYLSKAQFYFLQGDSAAYDRQILKALVSEDLEVDSKMKVLVDYTRTLMATGDSTGRIDTLMNVLIGQHPHEPQIHDLYSEYLIARKKYHDAAEQIGYVLDVQPTDADMWQKLMIVNMMDDNYPAAIDAAQKALEYNPDSLNLYSYIAPAYFQMKQYDKALETYNKALQMADSADIEMRSNIIGGMGDVYFEQGDTTASFNAYEEALQINPLNFGIMNNYAYFLALSNRELDKAERLAARAVKEYPTLSTYIDTYAWVFFKKKDYKMALFYIKSAMDNEDSPSADLYDHYGDILFMNGEQEQALEQWKNALKLDPENQLIKRKVANKTIFFE